MNCPDTDRLIEFADGATDPEVEVHVSTCISCRLELRILREASLALQPEFEVPSRLVERVVAAVAAEEQQSERTDLDTVFTGGLGALTGLGAVMATQSMGPGGGPVHLLGLAAVCGAVAVWVVRREEGVQRTAPGDG